MALHLGLALILALFVGSSHQQNSTERISCNPPFTAIGGHCLFIDPLHQGTWSEMRKYCQDEGGDLVILYTAQLYAEIVYHIKSQSWPSANYWVGGTDSGHEGIWAWHDDTLMRMGTPMWATGGCDNLQRPDGGTGENCAAMSSVYHLYINDLDCNIKTVHPICEGPIAKTNEKETK